MAMNQKKKTTAVLFVHGLQGSPGQLDFLLPALPEDAAFIPLTLPGHGGTLRAFRRSGRAQWLQSVHRAAVTLGQSYDRVIFVGHSMGCLLGIQEALTHGTPFASMLLIACPLRIRPTLRYLKTLLCFSLNLKKNDPHVAALRRANSVHPRFPWRFLFCLHPYLELLRLSRQVRRAKPKPLLRATAAFCAHDEIISPRSAREAFALWRFAPVTLPDSSHHLFAPQDQETLRRILSALIRNA